MWKASLLHPLFCCKKLATERDFICEMALEKVHFRHHGK
jgi:hypothetical protein